MQIEHVAIWTADIERLRSFYERYFGAVAGSKYINPTRYFESYFLSFDGGARVEIMYTPDVSNSRLDHAFPAGYAHLAINTGSKELVDSLTSRLRIDGYTVTSEPRTTGDGYYESVILDPDGNRVEIVA